MTGCFVTGTDTDVGKTFFTTALLQALRARGLDAGAFKPVQTGCTLAADGTLQAPDVEVYRSAGNYDGKKKIDGQITTDAAGRFSITAPDAGTYLALIRHRTASPAGAETPYRSYSYTLTFEATE